MWNMRNSCYSGNIAVANSFDLLCISFIVNEVHITALMFFFKVFQIMFSLMYIANWELSYINSNPSSLCRKRYKQQYSKKVWF